LDKFGCVMAVWVFPSISSSASPFSKLWELYVFFG
jgi:hypothetical protein